MSVVNVSWGNNDIRCYMLVWKLCYHGNRCITINFAAKRYMNFMFGTQVSWSNSNSWDYLLLWKACYHGSRDMSVTFLFNDIWISYLAHKSFGGNSIHNMICCHGDPFTMTTEKYLHYFAVWRHTNFIFVHTYLWATAIHSSICCFVNPVALSTKTYFSNHFIWGHMSFVFNMNVYWDDNSVSNHGMLLPQG